MENSMKIPQKNIWVELSYDIAILSWDIYPKKTKALIWKDIQYYLL